MTSVKDGWWKGAVRLKPLINRDDAESTYKNIRKKNLPGLWLKVREA